MANDHYSVLLSESIELLGIKPDGVYVDGTFGRGGHSREILAKLGPQGKVIAFDKDPDAYHYGLKEINDKRFILVHQSFANVTKVLATLEVKAVDGILLDLGVSSPQLDDKNRGFSFRFNAPLDMRMNNHDGESAREWINRVDEEELANVLWRYGEERFARRIARAIVLSRQAASVNTTHELASIIENAMPFKEKGKNPATRSFQAIRIQVNNELGELERLLEKIPQALAVNGRVVIISFHSLEDRIVKNAFNNLAKTEKLPKWVMQVPQLPEYAVVAKKVKASSHEIQENVRSRSGILRALQRLR